MTRRPGVLVPLLAAALLAGCGATGNGNSAAAPPAGGSAAPIPSVAIPSVAKDPALAGQVPASVAADGTLVVGSDASYPPNEFTAADGQTIVGMDVDLGTAIAQKLGLRAQFVNGSFDGLIPGLVAGRYELSMSSFTINAARLAQVDMVSYFSAGTSMAVPAGNPDKLTLDTLCGRTVAVQKGTVQVDDLSARSQKCTAAGQPAITLQQFQAQTDVTLALTAKRAQAMLADSPVIDYAVQQTNGALEVVGQPYDTAPYGVVVPKDDGRFARAVLGAVQALMTDGSYAPILRRWGVGAGALPQAQLDPAPAG